MQQTSTTRHDWVGKVVHWEMCKKFKFEHTNKWYYLPTPPLGQDMTQGQFLSGV